MPDLTYKEKMTIRLMRNKRAGLKPASQADIARRFELSRMYVNAVIAESQKGPKSDEWRKKFAAYAGIE
ncbi:hypothetical protein [Ligilactobacillus apodemi]|uniref:hypothetical protein n=1 Tax=Ligilactobacillus apodemi TaxID=307126 RepID=UPI00046975B7|nr:hypothetical protein [Ligilactobacillus apodemi]